MWDSANVVETETNPIRIIRVANHKSLEQLSTAAGVNLQTLYLNECGVFPRILPRIKDYLLRRFDCEEKKLDEDYKKFVLDKRRFFAISYADKVDVLPDPDLTIPPFQQYRLSLSDDLSRMGFAKTICVEPAGLYRLEKSPLEQLPGRLSEALLQVGLSSGNLEELEERTHEFYARSK